jgi:hypothetical protein
MFDENFKIEKREKSAFEPIPDDKYCVELLSVVPERRATYDTRLLPSDKQELETVLNFQFVVLDAGDFRGRNLWANFTPAYLYISKKGKNMLYQIVESLIGRELTSEDEAKLDFAKIKTLIGRQASVFTSTVTKGDKSYSNIIKLIPCANKLSPLTDEEKENAKVKPKTDEKPAESLPTIQVEEQLADVGLVEKEVSIDEIPF